MKFTSLPIPGLILIESPLFTDERGIFLETFQREKFHQAGIDSEFVQDNISVSHRGVLRGLHYQRPPHAQGKLVRVLHGAAFDVVVDIRKNSPTYGQHFRIELNEENMLMLWIPPGFAHGFATLQDETVFTYKVTGYYNRESESGIRYNDPALKIDWGITDPILSAKDMELPLFAQHVY